MTNLEMSSVSKNAGRNFLFFLKYSSVYVVLLAGFSISASEILKTAANFVALAFIFVCIFRFSLSKPGSSHAGIHRNYRASIPFYIVALSLMSLGMVLNLLVNFATTDFSEFLKFLIAPFFFLVGIRSADKYSYGFVEKPAVRVLVIYLIGVPLLVGIIGVMRSVGTSEVADSLSSDPVSIFSNRNNAALYAVALGATMNIAGVRWKTVLVYLLMVALLSGTIGILVSLLFSISFVFMRRRNIPLLLLLVLAIALMVSFFPEFGVIKRVMTLADGVSAFIALGDTVSISSMNYGDFSMLTGGGSDISFFFRLQHWADLLDKFWHKPALNVLFGNGVGSSVLLSTARLVPHNDYIRYLFECGFLPLLGFLLLNIHLLMRIGRNFLVVPFLAINIYFFSENLINNFLAMSFYYFAAGFTVKIRKRYIAHGNASE